MWHLKLVDKINGVDAWSNNFKNKVLIIQNHIVRQFKLSKKEMRSFKDIDTIVNKINYDYVTEFKEIEHQKEHLFLSKKDLKAWGVHPEDTSGVDPEKLYSDIETAKLFI